MADGRQRPPSLEGRRFRLFLVQLCDDMGKGRPRSSKGLQGNIRALFGTKPNGKDVLGQSQLSQYLRADNPKYASAGTVERVMRAYERVTKQRIRYEFFKDPALINPVFRDYLEPVGSAKPNVAAPQATSAPAPPKEPSPVMRVLDFAAERHASPTEIRKLMKLLERNGLIDDPQPRELETLFNELVRKRTPEQQANSDRDRALRLEREALGGKLVRLRPRPRKPSKKKRPPSGKPSRRSSPDATA